MSAKPKNLRTVTIKLEKISLGENSGWRKPSKVRIDQLKIVFKAGQWGQSVTSGIQLLPVQDSDGTLLDDGYSSVAALVDIRDEHKRLGTEPEDESLKEIFQNGLTNVPVVDYLDNQDKTLRFAWNVGKHDEESNTVRWSTIADKIGVAQDKFKVTGKWETVAKDLHSQFKFSMSTLKRWVRAAQGLDAEVLKKLDEEEYWNVKGAVIWDNDFLMGVGAKARTKLTPAYAIMALKHYCEQGNHSSESFINQVCTPLKTLELWDQLMGRRYGPTCRNSVAYTRLVERLMTRNGLQEITAANASNVPLHGQGRDNPGIEDCYLLVEAFKRCQAGGLPPPEHIPTDAELEKEAEAKKLAEQAAADAARKVEEETAAELLKRAQEEDLECMSCTTPAGSGMALEHGLVAQKSQSDVLMERDLTKVFFYDTPDAVLAGMEVPLRTCPRATIVLAAPTSGWNVISAYMKTAHDIIQMFHNGNGDPTGQHKIRVVILPGTRFDMMAKIQDKLSSTYPQAAWTVMTVQLQRRSTQTWNSKPTYAMVLVDRKDLGDGECVSLSLAKASSRILRKEGANLRCKDKACPLRPAAPTATGDILTSEIDEDDRTVPSQLSMMMAELAQAGGEGEGEDEGDDDEDDEDQKEAGAKEEHVVELWPFALTQDCWRQILHLGQGHKAQSIAILSPSAHPGPWVAARGLSAEVYVLTRRQHPHAMRHGLELGKKLRREAVLPAPPAGPGVSAVPRDKDSLITIQGWVNVGDSVIEAYDMHTGTHWADGLNLGLHGDSLNTVTTRMVSEQLDTFELSISAVDAKVGRGLEVRTSMREGQSIPATALFFDDQNILEAWIRKPGNLKYTDRIVKLPGVLKHGDPVTIFAVLVGAAQYVNDYQNIRKSANAKFVFTPNMGFNHGALQLVISTRNGAGVGKGAPLLAAYGEDFDKELASEQAPPSKKYKGALDMLFDEQKNALPEEADEHAAAALEEAAAEKKKLEMEEADRKRKAQEELAAETAKRARLDAESERKKLEEDKAKEALAAVAAEPMKDRGTLINTLSGVAPCEFRVHEDKLLLLSTDTAPKKLPKHTCLMQWTKNTKVTSKSTPFNIVFPYELEPKSLIYSKESDEVITLSKACQNQYKTFGTIFGYTGFVAGSPPKVMVKISSETVYSLDLGHESFKSTFANAVKVIELARGAPGLKVLWMMKAEPTKKWVQPCGLMVCTLSQIHLKALNEHKFE